MDEDRSDNGAIREGEPVFFRGSSRNASTLCELDVTGTKNNELPLAVQFAAVLILWFTWLAVLAFVIWRRSKLQGEMRYYDYPFFVYPIVFTYIPLALVVLDVLFLWRLPHVEPVPRSNRTCRFVVAGLTLVTAGVLLTAGLLALSIPWQVVRE